MSNVPAQSRATVNGQLLQTSLSVNAPNDQYEQEADQVADAVMRMPASTPALPPDEIDTFQQSTVSRLPGISRIQMSGGEGAFQAPASVENRINQMQGNGSSLPAPVGDNIALDKNNDQTKIVSAQPWMSGTLSGSLLPNNSVLQRETSDDNSKTRHSMPRFWPPKIINLLVCLIS